MQTPIRTELREQHPIPRLVQVRVPDGRKTDELHLVRRSQDRNNQEHLCHWKHWQWKVNPSQ